MAAHTIAARRHLAGLVGTTVRTFDQHDRLAYVKVVEYQARGLIHVNALIRLDLVDATHSATDSAVLAAAVLAAVAKASAPNPIREARRSGGVPETRSTSLP